MSDGSRLEAIVGAKRALHRQEMRDFGHELTWLRDPGEIPEEAITSGADGDVNTLCFNLATWMIESFGQWSGKGYRRLDLKGAYGDRGLSVDARLDITSKFKEKPGAAYAPGVKIMSEIFGVVPLLVARAGGAREDWNGVASQARQFGALLSRDSTHVQAIVRQYLWDPAGEIEPEEGKELTVYPHQMDPRKLQPDEETGISTITPVTTLVETTDRVMKEVLVPQAARVCVALQVSSPFEDGKGTFFDSAWDAFGAVAEQLIYPRVQLPAKIPPEGRPDPRYEHFARARALERQLHYFRHHASLGRGA